MLHFAREIVIRYSNLFVDVTNYSLKFTYLYLIQFQYILNLIVWNHLTVKHFFQEFDDLISWSNVPYSIFWISLDYFNVLTFWQFKGRFEETLHVMRGSVLTLYATKTCYSQNLFAVSKSLLTYESSTKSKWFIILRFDTIFVWTFEARLTDLYRGK